MFVRRPMRRRLLVAWAAAVATALLVPAGATAGPASGSLVSVVPVSGTPHVLNGRVNAIAKVGSKIVLGGSFSQARNNASTEAVARANLLAFDENTHQLSTTFLPTTNGPVSALLAAPDGQSVYIGGSFSTVNGQPVKNLARVHISDGSLVTTFNPATVAGPVKDLKLAGGRLWVGGAFTHIAGRKQLGLATVNPETGAFNPFMRGVVAGTHNGGYTTVLKFDINAAGTRLVAVGNFETYDGVKNRQLFMLDLTGATAAQAAFQTSFYEDTHCYPLFDTYMRDLDFSPDGSFFVVSTTGAWGGPTSSCDTTARFETGTTGTGVTPSWINHTGGDTTYAVEITDSVVYTGGHARWQNNPFAGDQTGQGAVSRPGIAALDPINGLPLSWNPTRERGVGVFDFLVTPAGLWVASDTDRIGDYYLRSRIALLPAAGGTSFPIAKTPSLPNTVYLAGTSGLAKAWASGTGFTASGASATGGLAWANVKGAFMLNGWLYTAWADGTFNRRQFDGVTFGAAEAVNTHDQLTQLTDWRSDIQGMTGMFYDSGRIYFTKSGEATLYYRYFTAESKVVGAARRTASAAVGSFDPAQVRSMFVAGDSLYFGDATGRLRRIGWTRGAAAGAPTGSAMVVSGPSVDTLNWTAQAYFLFQDAEGDNAVAAPSAAFTTACTSLECSFDATGSQGNGATISSYAWQFGDGTTGTGATPAKTYAAAGTYNVTLTVTTSKGHTATTTKTVSLTRVSGEPPAASVGFVAAASSNGNRATHTVTVPASAQAGDALVLVFSGNSSSAAPSTAAGWTLLKQTDASGLVGYAWTKTATAADAGSTVSVTTAALYKSDLSVAAYRGQGGAVSVSAAEAAARTASASTLTSPTVTASSSGSWLVSYWAAKASAALTITGPAGQTQRTGSQGTGSGAVTALLADSAAGVATGGAGGLTANLSTAASRGAMFSIVVTPS